MMKPNNPNARTVPVLIGRTHDVSYLQKLAREYYELTSDDATPAKAFLDLRAIARDKRHWFLRVLVGGKPAGLFAFYLKRPDIYEGHVVLTPQARGLIGLAAGRMALQFMFEIARARQIICQCPETNRASLFYALRCGFKVLYRRHDWRKNGATYFSTWVTCNAAPATKGVLCPG
jgi:RimJ/RimL family protein N-acetyltransferase